MIEEVSWIDITEYSGSILYLRKHTARDIEQFQQFFIPVECMDIEQQGSGSIRDIGRMDFAAGKFPQQETVDRSKQQIRIVFDSGDIVPDPFDLGSGEIRVQN